MNTTHIVGMPFAIAQTLNPSDHVPTTTNDADLTCFTTHQGQYSALVVQVTNDGVPCTAGCREDVLQLSIS